MRSGNWDGEILFSIEILAIRVRSELSSNLQYEYEVLIDYRKHKGFSILIDRHLLRVLW
jgi:hypothetical protein